MKAHCLFEQSGTFKNEFIKLGIPAEDYDILNDFGQTDHIVDLFAEIEKAYGGGYSVFDTFSKEDIVMAFFPCIRFEDQALLLFRCDQYQLRNKTDIEKLEIDVQTHQELSLLYDRISKLAIVCLRKCLRLIIENPYSVQHYLTKYWALKPALIDNDRTERGDYYKKPTQYWFINAKPQSNFLFEPLEYVKLHTISNYNHDKNNRINGTETKVSRSMIHPQYANRFIREFILEAAQ